MVGGPGPGRVEDGGPDTSHLGPGLLSGEVSLAEEDPGVVTELADTVGRGEDSEGGEERAATQELNLISPGQQRSQGCSPGLAGSHCPLSAHNPGHRPRPGVDEGANRLSWILQSVESEDPAPGTWLGWRC